MQQPYSEENAHKPTPPACKQRQAGLAIVTMDACNSEKLSDLNIEPPDDIKRNIPDWVSQHNKTFQLDIKAVQIAC